MWAGLGLQNTKVKPKIQETQRVFRTENEENPFKWFLTFFRKNLMDFKEFFKR